MEMACTRRSRPGSRTASPAVFLLCFPKNLVVESGNPAVIIVSKAVDCYECSCTSNGDPASSSLEIIAIDLETRFMTFSAGVTFTSGLCLPEKKVLNARGIGTDGMILQLRTDINANKTSKRTVPGGFEASDDVAITKLMLIAADVTVFGATGRPPQTQDTDQVAEEKGDLMASALCEMTFPGKYIFLLKMYSMLKVTCKVARVKQPVVSLEISSEPGISENSKHRTKSMSPQLRVPTMCQMWLFLLVIVLSASQLLSCAEATEESAEIGSCRFDITSLATLSCVEPGGIWRPPSMTCCNALLYAIDRLPASNESGACCLCRYIHAKYSHFALATSYVLCQGKDRHIVTTWSSLPLRCYLVCRQRHAASSHGMGTAAQEDFPVVHVQDIAGTSNLMMPWIAAAAAAALCGILLACCCYHWRHKPVADSCELQPLNLQRQGLPIETQDECRPSARHFAAQRRLSSRGSPNG